MIIGAPSYINCLPLFYPLVTKQVFCEFEFVFAIPSIINKLLDNNEIDVGLVSSAYFLENIFKYKIAANFGICASSEVMSVALFTRQKEPKTIYVPKSSASSIALLQVICHKFWQIKPRFIPFDDDECYAQFDAYLLIGDKCLSHPEVEGITKIDLASVWYEFTQKPFAFALFAGKETNFEELDALLVKALKWSKKNVDEIITYAKQRVNLPENELRKYFTILNYRLDKSHFDSLKLFGDYVREEKSTHYSLTI
jgi:chorismate dehydratase